MRLFAKKTRISRLDILNYISHGIGKIDEELSTPDSTKPMSWMM